jgi:squalene synthase HpnC
MENGAHPSRVTVAASPADVPDAAAILAQAGDENFPVASRVLPRSVRPHLLAVYGFARLADDLGDEADGDRLALLDWLEAELELAAVGKATHPLLRRVGATIRDRALPLEPFRRLVEANRQDQLVHRYASFDDLLGYCRLSANPVGELVLRILGQATPARLRWSDEVCSGLQVVEHLQDVAEDARAGRAYLPGDDMARFGCTDAALLASTADAGLRALVLFEAERAEQLLSAAVPLTRSLRGRARLGVATFAAGGLAAIDAIRAADGDTLANHCRPHRPRLAGRWVQVLLATSREER